MFSEDLYFTSKHAKGLYEAYAKDLPIIDYHCHLSPQEIYEDRQFEDLGEMWLAHDHYKWRAMRAFGIDEALISGGAPYYDKFLAFAGILPRLIGNPLYIWCALELKRYFGIDEPLCAENAKRIYERTKAIITERGMGPSHCIERSNIEFIATTDDPADDLRYHRLIAEQGRKYRVSPAFRPDRALNAERPGFPEYLAKLGTAAGMGAGSRAGLDAGASVTAGADAGAGASARSTGAGGGTGADADAGASACNGAGSGSGADASAGNGIDSFRGLIEALGRRLDYFKSFGPPINDNAVTQFEWADYTDADAERVFQKARAAAPLSRDEINLYRSAFLCEMLKLYAERGFATQLHIGAYRDVNSAMHAAHGPDSGYDAIDDAASVRSFGCLLDRAASEGALPKIIFYPLDINQYEAFAVLATVFSGGGKGSLQLGAPWWFNDQIYGIAKQLESVSCLYPVALSVGMLTDSRSFLSYPRHELYRRVLCNYFGTLLDRREYFSGEQELGSIIGDICYRNAKEFFGI
ncbi:MAG: glucuronate isomerase [Clostridiales bacterium]|jgi:glucuronate isomerase|nr:glucuronate isomerase [Clostridiales bacterium]